MMTIVYLVFRAQLARPLAANAHAMWPWYPSELVQRAAEHAIEAATSRVDAATLVRVTEHESSFEPDAVTYTTRDARGSHRHDGTLRDGRALPAMVFCGYVQALMTLDDCRREASKDGAMRAGMAELTEWADTCSHHFVGEAALACTMRGHAGGTACALDEKRCKPNQRAFARMFVEGARRLRLPSRAAAASRRSDATAQR